MDLGIAGRWALVCAGSRGLGKACAKALVQEGANVVVTGRDKTTLGATVQELEALNPKATVIGAPGDITTEAGQKDALAAAPVIDILVTNAGGPPPGNFRDWTHETWQDALNANMLTPIALIQATIDGMISRKFGRIINITSLAVKAPIAILGLSNGARAGLTGFVAGLSRDPEIVANNVTLNNILPGWFGTDRGQQALESLATKHGLTLDQALVQRLQAIPAGRFGMPEEFGATCAFLCSRFTGYLTGQNILLDGGEFRGTL